MPDHPLRRSESILPLSANQRAMWFVQGLAPESTAYNALFAARVRGALDPARLRVAAGLLAARHPLLRASFHLDGGAPVQRIHAHLEPALRIERVADRGADLRALALAEVHRPFDLERGPAWRLAALELGADDHLLVLTIHHLIADLATVVIVIDELLALHAEGPAAPLPGLARGFADYVEWHEGLLAGPEGARLRDHWRDRLSGALHDLDLPLDLPRPPVQTYEGSSVVVPLPAGLRARVRALAGEQAVTPFAVLLAAYQALLGRWCGQSSFLVGTPVPGRRSDPALERVVGNFMNMLPLRADLAGDPSFLELVRRVGGEVSAARAGQEYPLPAVVQDLVRHRDPSRSPLFQTLFTLQRAPVPALTPFFVRTGREVSATLGGLVLEPVDLGQQEGQLELALELVEVDGDYCGELKFNTSLLHRDTAEALARAYATLLDAALAEPARPLSRLPLLAAEGRAAALLAGTGPAAQGPAGDGFVGRFLDQVARTPDAVAARSPGLVYTYAELRDRAAAIAGALRARGVSRDRIVAVEAERGPLWLAGLVGVLLAGAAYLALDPEHPPARRAELLRLADMAGVLTSDDVSEPAALAPGAWRLDLASAAAGTPSDDLARPGPRDLAYAIFTSGSTGAPKGALVTHGGMENHLLAKLADLEIAAGDVVAQSAPQSFVIANWQALAGLVVGAAIAFVGRESAGDPQALLARVAADRVTVLQIVPSLLRATLEHLESAGAPALPDLRWLVPTGEALPADLCRRWHALYPEIGLLNAYGCSECSDDVAHHRVDPHALRGAVVPLGRPLPGIRLYVLDEHLQPLPDGAVGDLWVGGVAPFRGYLGDPERTAAVLRRDPFASDPDARIYRTGDRVRRRPDGVFEYLGRADDQVKIRGVRIELGEVEAALRAHPGVREAAITAERDPHGDARLVAHVVAREPALARAALHSALAARLPAALLPAAYVFHDALPASAHGKLDRRALAARAREALSAGTASEKMSGGTGSAELAALAEVWRDLLGVAEVGPDDDFFALGGHSLLAVRLLVRVRERFGVELPLSAVFELSTVAAMARAIAAAAPARELPGARFRPAPARAHEPFPLTDLQQAYWIGQAAADGGPAIAYLEHDLEDMSTETFADALQQLVERHPMLRAVIRGDGTQQVLPAVGRHPIDVLDQRGRPAEEVEAGLARTRAALSSFTVEPDRWPLLRLCLHRLSERRVRLQIGFPLLLGDLQSFRVISRELGELAHGRELPPLPLSYRDCVVHLVAAHGGPEHARSEAYWRGRLAELPPAPELPRVAEPPAAGAAMARHAGLLPTGQWQALRRRAQAAGLTPTALIAAVYAEVLARFARAPHFTLNLLVQRRPSVHPQVEEVVGNFSSTVLLAVDHRGGGPFVARARALQAQLWRDLEHAQVSGVQVVRELARARGEGVAAAMPVVLASTLHLEAEEFDAPDLLGPPLSSELRTPHVWIDHQVAQTRAGLRFHWDVLEDMFPPGLAAAMFACYADALARLADDAAWTGTPVALPAAELAAREAANATEAPVPDALLHALFFDQAARTPDAVAVITGERVLTYGELADRATDLAQGLRQLGARPNQLVAICMRKGWEQVVAALAVLAAGAAYLPIDPELPAERRHLLLQSGQAQIVLTQPELARGLAWPAEVRAIAVDERPPPTDLQPLPAVQRTSDLAYVLFTSGSTGAPKGVMIDHRGAVNTVLDINRRFAVGKDDRALAVSSLSFDLSVYDLFGLLAAGGAIVVPDPARVRDPAHWLRLVTGARVTLWNSVPQLMQLLVDHAEQTGAGLGPLRLALLSGDWVPLDLAPRLWKRAPQVKAVSLGGATEASIWSIAHPIEHIDPRWASIPYGRPLANQRFHVLDDALQPRPTGVPGELYIAGVGLAQGYWADAARTRERFFPHPVTGERLYRTGDLGRYLEDGSIEFLGRVDAQVKIQGYRIELGEIEAHLAQVPGVRACAVAAQGPVRGPRRLVAYVVGEAQDPAALREHLSARLPGYMVPAVYVPLERLPLTGNGKLDRNALPAPDPASARRRETVPPRDDLERALAGLWREVLGAPELGARDDFFADLGGDSFAAVRLLARVAQVHGRAPSLAEFLRAPTLADQAAALRGGLETSGDPRVVLREGRGAPLFLVHPIGGGALCYRGLAAALGERPVIGLQARGLAGEAPLASVSEMAGLYAEAIERTAPQGPVHLGGWSMGGLVAQEVARALEQRGREVAALVLLDPAAPGAVPRVDPSDLRRWLLRDLARDPARDDASSEHVREDMSYDSASEHVPEDISEDADLATLLTGAQRRGRLVDVRPGELAALHAVFAAHQRAMEDHAPAPARAPALLLHADAGAADLRPWPALVGTLRARPVPGDHYSMFAPARLPALGAEVERFLAAAEVSA